MKHTAKQSQLSRSKRLANPINAFKIRQKYMPQLKEKTVLLFDDVIATGTTANEAARILKQSGAEKVFLFSLAVSRETLKGEIWQRF